jgi:hypothetical protein
MEASTKMPKLEAVDMEVQAMDHDGHASHGPGTVKDHGDMQRMGKVQEFKVCIFEDTRFSI